MEEAELQIRIKRMQQCLQGCVTAIAEDSPSYTDSGDDLWDKDLDMGDAIPIQTIAGLLKKNRHLLRLDVSGNHIEDYGVAALAEAVALYNTSLTWLAVGSTDVGLDGAVALPVLTELTVWDTPYVGDDGVAALAKGLGESRSTDVPHAWLPTFRRWQRGCYQGYVSSQSHAQAPCAELQYSPLFEHCNPCGCAPSLKSIWPATMWATLALF